MSQERKYGETARPSAPEHNNFHMLTLLQKKKKRKKDTSVLPCKIVIFLVVRDGEL